MSDIEFSIDTLITAEDLMPLFAQTAWAHTRTPQEIEIMLANSALVVGVWHEDRLIGFMRVVSDNVYRAYIEDVIVDASLRGQGIGDAMVRFALEQLEHIEEILLNTEDERVAFYERIGFRRSGHNNMNIWRG